MLTLSLDLVPPPPPLPDWDVRWGDAATCARESPGLIREVVDSVDRAYAAERASVPHPRGSPVPASARVPIMRERMMFVRGVVEVHDIYAMAEGQRDRSYARPQFQLRFDHPPTIDKLFNHPGGLRGNYAVSAASGQSFTLALIRELLPLLETVMADFRDPSRPPTWMETNAGRSRFRQSMEAGKVWMEPVASEGLLTDHGAGNVNWVPREHFLARERREGFIAEITRLAGGAAGRDAFLGAATGDPGGLMGRTADLSTNALGHPTDWRLQNAGAMKMGASGSCYLQVTGALMNRGGDILTPARKIYRAESLHWFGYT